ncbi:hypothetical protein [Mycobacterium talmoniae]|uniref:Mce-associated membrane protein n=1 Tax=Mycobacterium talmoniae TaxID=1858794 RepID=A0A1S1NRB3_9MYCO|nr:MULTISPECIES: hypothetical protein [Mycobacterium]OHV06223.1 hypothetical protein BKN37_02975 [Mycobacterium talmoniae]PQM48698.1 hypothetical protein C1Y40_01064 [Mycobacterium talmoniae]TDH57076.1 hypothetical protein E2F47_04055 [Mycobacterium eburneum]
MNITETVEDTKLTDADDSEADDSDAAQPDEQACDDQETDVAHKDSATGTGRRISVSVRGLSLAVLITALVAALSVMTWLYIGANRRMDAHVQQEHDYARAEQVALDYAVRAAIMDHKDLGPWKRALVEGTTPELSKKLTDAANAMEQILLPLEWSSVAKPIAAKVRSHDKSVYVVDAFVSVMTKTVQAAQNLQSTATYAVTVDSANGWTITDVGGIGQVVGDK